MSDVMPPVGSSGELRMGDTVRMSAAGVLGDLRSEQPHLLVVSGAAMGRVFALPAAEAVIGRSAECQIVLDDAVVSRRHARISPADGRTARLADTGSSNGTYFHGVRTASAVLADGDLFQLGGGPVLKFIHLGRLERDCLDNLYRAATYDALTGVLNRRHLVERLKHEFAFHARHELPLSAVVLDIDGLKALNEKYGQTPAGDSLLAQVAAAVRSALRTEDVFGRFAGGEFLTIARATDRTQAAGMAERLRRLIEGAVFEVRGPRGEPQPVRITASLGTATVQAGGISSPEELLTAALRALRLAKREGRNKVCSDIPVVLPPITVPPRAKIGSILLRNRKISRDQLQRALRLQKSDPAAGPLGTILLSMGACTEADIAAALAAQYGVGADGPGGEE